MEHLLKSNVSRAAVTGHHDDILGLIAEPDAQSTRQAAGDAVLRGAGGRVVRFDDHQPLAYGKPGWDNPFFIAFAPGVTLQ